MKLLYKSVYLKGLGLSLPPRKVTSQEIENRLSPMYERLGLHAGRLELMTGISSRHLGDPGLRPSDLSIDAAQKALEATGVKPEKIGCLIHSAVCRDFLEPSTATVIHRKLGLSPDCQVFDLSNACLGWLNGIIMVANMVELGQIEAGLVVTGEDGRGLVESTINALNQDTTLNRQSIKSHFASLTIGSGGVAAVITSEKYAEGAHRLLGATTQCATEFNELCQGGLSPEESTRTQIEMVTHSEEMLHAGVGLAAQNWAKVRGLLNWTTWDVHHFITHQVGSAHQRMLYEKLELDISKDYSTFPHLGNMGSASIGATLAMAESQRRLNKGEHVLLMGIGSGLVSMMMGLEW